MAIGWIALKRGLRVGLLAAVLATAGATAGGAALYLAADQVPATVRRIIEDGPAVPTGAIARAEIVLRRDDWPTQVLAAAFSGRPYRVYAAAAPAAGVSAPMFVAATPAVRAPRFLLVAAAFALIGGLMRRRASPRVALALYVAGWSVFYAVYWAITPG